MLAIQRVPPWYTCFLLIVCDMKSISIFLIYFTIYNFLTTFSFRLRNVNDETFLYKIVTC